MRYFALLLGLLAAMLALGAQNPELRRYRLGLSCEQILRMGFDRWSDYFDSRVEYSGVMRGVADGVYVDCIRERNARLVAKRPARDRQRLKEIDRLLRFSGVMIARTDWLFVGGNAFDPDSDTQEMAQAEYDLVASRDRDARKAVLLRSAMQDRLTAYGREVERALASGEPLHGAMDDRRRGVAEARNNVRRLRRYVAQLERLVRGRPHEALVVYRFLRNEATLSLP